MKTVFMLDEELLLHNMIDFLPNYTNQMNPTSKHIFLHQQNQPYFPKTTTPIITLIIPNLNMKYIMT